MSLDYNTRQLWYNADFCLFILARSADVSSRQTQFPAGRRVSEQKAIASQNVLCLCHIKQYINVHVRPSQLAFKNEPPFDKYRIQGDLWTCTVQLNLNGCTDVGAALFFNECTWTTILRVVCHFIFTWLPTKVCVCLCIQKCVSGWVRWSRVHKNVEDYIIEWRYVWNALRLYENRKYN